MATVRVEVAHFLAGIDDRHRRPGKGPARDAKADQQAFYARRRFADEIG